MMMVLMLVSRSTRRRYLRRQMLQLLLLLLLLLLRTGRRYLRWVLVLMHTRRGNLWRCRNTHSFFLTLP